MGPLKQVIADCGFEEIGQFDTDTLEVHQEVRDMCAVGTCQMYGKSWSCPPACGELDELEKKFKSYKHGYVFETVYPMEDEFDIESIEAAGKVHDERFNALVHKVKEAGIETLPLAAGTCTLCKTCTYPDKPCIQPDKMYPSMEACGLLVSQICEMGNVAYYHGPNTTTLVSCALFNKD